ncbi:MAG TPA: PAS domain-containing protein [Sedimentibacter sp.]|nr:PAS domain-containing protein [Sedimentibacter sp.]
MNDYKSIEPYQLSIADGMIDWVRVVDKNNVVLYVNKKMQEDLKEDIVGKKCFDVLCRDKRCDFCISSITMESGNIMRKQQKFRDKTYMIISSPLYGKDGEIEGSVEVFRDITKEVLLAEEINERNRKMSEEIKLQKTCKNACFLPREPITGSASITCMNHRNY